MSRSRTSLPILLTPLGASFRCSACGDCCRPAWGVNLDERSFHAISGALLRHTGPGTLRPEETMTLLDDPRPDLYGRLVKRKDGACVFLDSDNLCYLHKHFGAEMKPPTCRTFPFRPVVRPDGVHAPASLSCTSLRRTLSGVRAGDDLADPGLRALTDADADPFRALADLAYERYSPGAYVYLRKPEGEPRDEGKGGAKKPAPAPTPEEALASLNKKPRQTTPARMIRVESASALEERLVGLLHEPSLPLTHRLLGVRYVVEHLCEGKGAHVLGGQVEDAFPIVLGEGFATLRTRISALSPSVRTHLGYQFHLLSLIEETTGRARHIGQRQALRFGLGAAQNPAELEDIAVRLFGWRYTIERTGLLPMVETYLGERLRASSLTLRFGYRGMTQALVCGASLLRFFACGRAGEHSREVAADDLAGAIGEVDELFFHNVVLQERLFGEEATPQFKGPAHAEDLMLLPPAPPPFGGLAAGQGSRGDRLPAS